MEKLEMPDRALLRRVDGLERRVVNLERKASKGQRIFVQWDDGRGITEGGEPRTLADVSQAEKDGFVVVLLKVVHDEHTSKAG